MNRTFRTIATTVALAASMATAASAKTIAFDFTGTGKAAPAFSYSQDGIDLAVFGATYANGRIEGANLTEWDRGFGMSSYHGDNHMIDGGVKDEFAGLYFSQKIDRIESITFDFVDRDDRFTLLGIEGHAPRLLKYDLISSTANGHSTVTYTFGEDFGGNLFGIGATGDHDTFKLRGLTVSVDDAAPVPLPAGGLLLLSGLVGLGAARRLRKTA